MKKHITLLATLLALVLSATACQSTTPSGSSAPENTQGSVASAADPSDNTDVSVPATEEQQSDSDVSAEPDSEQGNEDQAPAGGVDLLVQIYGLDTELGAYIKPDELPKEVAEQMDTVLYPNSIITYMWVEINKIGKGLDDRRTINFFEEPSAENIFRLEEDEYIGMFALSMYTTDEQSVANAYYEAKNPDRTTSEYGTSSFFHSRQGGEGSYKASTSELTVYNCLPEVFDAFTTEIGGVCEWIPD